MAKKVVLSGYYGYDNFGDEAILSVLISHLQQIGADITVLSHNPQKTASSYQVNTVKNFNILGVINALKNCDLLISGGGSLLQDVTSLKSLLYYAFVIFMAQLLKKEVVIFAQGIGPLQKEISQKIVRNLMSKCQLVTVRDIKSAELLKSWEIDAQLVSDPVFSIDLPHDRHAGTVGIQLRQFKTINDEFLHNLAEQVITDFADRKIELYVFQNALDMDICLKFEKMLKQLYPSIETEIIHSISLTDMMLKISRLEYLIAMRFHAVLVAVKAGVPVAAINYDAKVAKLAYEAMLPLITISEDEDFTSAFTKLKQLTPETLLTFAKTKNFEWTIFDNIWK